MFSPLPEGLANHVLTRMLALVPYQMPAKGGKAERTKDGLHPKGASDIVSGEIKIPSSEDKNEGEVNASSPHGKKRPPLKIGRKRLLSEARCLCRAAQAWRTSMRGLMMRTSLGPNRK